MALWRIDRRPRLYSTFWPQLKKGSNGVADSDFYGRDGVAESQLVPFERPHHYFLFTPYEKGTTVSNFCRRNLLRSAIGSRLSKLG